MHDCRSCQTPLHGHESFCPVCGLKQYVRPQFQGVIDQFQQGFNPIGLVLTIFVLGGLLFYAVQSSWIGQAIRRGPVAQEVDNAVTAAAAREKLENAIDQNLASQSSTGKFTYMAGDKKVDRNYPQAVEMTIDVRLKYPSKRREIIDPIKSLMIPAHVNTITLNDSRSRATVTYSVASSTADDNDQASNTANTSESN